MIKWEYKVILLGNFDETIEETLNKHGEDGWELGSVAPNGRAMLLKRPKDLIKIKKLKEHNGR